MEKIRQEFINQPKKELSSQEPPNDVEYNIDASDFVNINRTSNSYIQSFDEKFFGESFINQEEQLESDSAGPSGIY